ncbi:MAG: 2-phosphosulfolactate phosphatase [Methanobrevibacter sp.]|nr:2-phosphosulfolactate phosphatase [Methanobrevibacter sp.]
MKVTLSFEKTSSSDVSIMVDVLRASTTITTALDNYDKIIPCFTPEEAFELKNETNGVIAGERGGAKIEGFDIGNSPNAIKEFESESNTLILTTSNGTRILKDMDSKVLIGCLNNAQSVAKASLNLAKTHIDVVMAGVRGEFAIEDYLAAGEILYQIIEICKECEISEYAKEAISESRDYDKVKKAFHESRSGKRLTKLGYLDDIDLSLKINSSRNVGLYDKNSITRLIFK